MLFAQTENGILDLQTRQVHHQTTINLCHRFRQLMYHERIFSNNCDDDIATYLYIYTVVIVVLIQSYLHFIGTPQGLNRHFRFSILVLSLTLQNVI